MKYNIGFMQGRLSPRVHGKIQAFPWENWKEEFYIAHDISMNLMEWTLDQEDLYKNPLMNSEGQKLIQKLSSECGVAIDSLTGDCFMQSPFFKNHDDMDILLHDYENIVNACGLLKIKFIVFPLVDNSSISNVNEEKILRDQLLNRVELLRENKVQIVFESDFEPLRLQKFIDDYPAEFFGVNYDMGNSAALGFKSHEEIEIYGARIYNVHVKDRVLKGTTVPLGHGNVDFKQVFSSLLNRAKYKGNFILQTARSSTDEHAKAILEYRSFTERELNAWT